jgi:hypothetical protein
MASIPMTKLYHGIRGWSMMFLSLPINRTIPVF